MGIKESEPIGKPIYHTCLTVKSRPTKEDAPRTRRVRPTTSFCLVTINPGVEILDAFSKYYIYTYIYIIYILIITGLLIYILIIRLNVYNIGYQSYQQSLKYATIVIDSFLTDERKKMFV